MENIHQKFVNSLIDAEKLWQSADHLVYITLPVVKDSKLLLRALENVHKSIVLIISTILKFEYMYRRIELDSDPEKNRETFFKKCSVNYGLSMEKNAIIKEIMTFGRKHKESGMEFTRRGRLFITDDEMATNELDVGKMKQFLGVSRELLENTNRQFREFTQKGI